MTDKLSKWLYKLLFYWLNDILICRDADKLLVLGYTTKTTIWVNRAQTTNNLDKTKFTMWPPEKLSEWLTDKLTDILAGHLNSWEPGAFKIIRGWTGILVQTVGKKNDGCLDEWMAKETNLIVYSDWGQIWLTVLHLTENLREGFQKKNDKLSTFCG